jgi:hypothetical protein
VLLCTRVVADEQGNDSLKALGCRKVGLIALDHASNALWVLVGVTICQGGRVECR